MTKNHVPLAITVAADIVGLDICAPWTRVQVLNRVPLVVSGEFWPAPTCMIPARTGVVAATAAIPERKVLRSKLFISNDLG